MGLLRNLFNKKQPEVTLKSSESIKQPRIGDASRRMQGILILSCLPLKDKQTLLQQIIDKQCSNGYSIAPDLTVMARVAGDSLNDMAYVYASLREDFSHLGGHDLMDRTAKFDFQASDGNFGNYYLIFDFGSHNIEKLEQEQDINGLIKALGGYKDVIRLQAAKALEKIGTLSVVPLIATWRDEDADSGIHSEAAEVLERIGTPAVEPLTDALREESEVVRRWAAMVLGDIKDARAVEPLIAVLNDKDEVVQWNAAEALKKIIGKNFEDPAKWQEWWEKNKAKFLEMPATDG